MSAKCESEEKIVSWQKKRLGGDLCKNNVDLGVLGWSIGVIFTRRLLSL